MRFWFDLGLLVASSVAVGAAAGQSPVAPLPLFRATDVRVLDDTAWFFSGRLAEGAKRHPVIGFIPATGQWITALRLWRTLDSLGNLHSRSGPVDTRPNESQAIGPRYGLVDGRTSYEGNEVTRFALVRPDGRRVRLRLDDSPTARRALYREGGGRVTVRHPAPSFSRMPSVWAAASGRIAFAFPGWGPPPREWFWSQMADTGQWNYAPLLSGVLVFDVATSRLTSLAHPKLIERGWRGIELVDHYLFVAPDSLNDDRYETHPAATSRTPRLARYDFSTNRWMIYRPADLPTGEAPLQAIASDDRHVYVASDTGVAVLDVESNTWNARFYADRRVVVADGADSVITELALRAVAPVAEDTSERGDTAHVLEVLATRLAVRHQSALERTMLELIPFDSLADVASFVSRMDERANTFGDMDAPFGPSNATMQVVMARAKFEPFLREAMWRVTAQDFALGTLRRMGEVQLVSALRATLDSGSAPAAVAAADTLLRRHDPAAIRWLRRQVEQADVPMDFEPEGRAWGGWPMRSIVYLLASHDDTASIPSLVRLLVRPEHKLVEAAERQVLEAMMAFPSDEAHRRISDAVAERRGSNGSIPTSRGVDRVRWPRPAGSSKRALAL
jgi:hypothetical protein